MIMLPPPDFNEAVPGRRVGLRLAGIVLLVAAGMALLTISPEGGDVSGTRWYIAATKRPLIADCTYRLGVFLDDLNTVTNFGEEGAIHDLQDHAVGDYERAALRRDLPDALAAQRLGAIYARRGYREQAKDMFARAAQLDDVRAEMYLADATVYDDAVDDTARLRNIEFALSVQEPWIRGMVLPDYYRRLGDEARAAQVEADWHQEQARFGKGLLVILGVVVFLVLLGVATIVYGFLRSLARTKASPTQPPLLRSWGVFDVAEVSAGVFALIVALESVAGFLRGAGGTGQIGAVPDALIGLGFYAMFAVLALLLARRCVADRGRGWLAELGLEREGAIGGLLLGVRGYGVFIALLAGVGVALDGASVPTLGAREITGDFLRGLREPVPVAIYFVLLCVITPVVEELIFRGFAYAGLRQRLSPLMAMVSSAALFSAVHLGASQGGQVFIFAIGLLLANLYERKRSVWPCIAAHALHNTLFFALTVLQAW